MAGKRGRPPSGPEARAARAHPRLGEITAAAVKLFYERGYHGTDLRLIASEVGMHPSSFYNYIKSKEEILYLILRDGIDGVNASLGEVLQGVGDPIEALRKAIEFHVLWCTTKRYVSWTQIVELPSLTGAYRKEIIAKREVYQQRFTSILQRGVESGAFGPMNVLLVAFGLLGMMSSVARWYSPQGDASPQTIADTIADLVIEGLRNTGSREASVDGHGERPDMASH